MIILAIETSCDETAAAIAEFKTNAVRILANVVSSQIKAHREYGGVVPSLASRMHLKNMIPVLAEAFEKAKVDGDKIDYIAVTSGPGLIPALMVGVNAAKTLSYVLDKPLVGINHLEGHIYIGWLKTSQNSGSALSAADSSKDEGQKLKKPAIKNKDNFRLWKPKFPVLCLIASGGHTQLVLMKKDLDYKTIGKTLDDAAGEAFDKVAKLLGLDYPGGPSIEKLAKKGDRDKFKLARPMINSKNYDFSFSGLKTAVLYEIRSRGISDRFCKKKIEKAASSKDPLLDQYRADIAASFQQAVVDVLVYKTIKAAEEYKVRNILLGGGVAANKELQNQLCGAVKKKIPNCELHIPRPDLVTDNALMIALAAYYRIVNGEKAGSWQSLEANANKTLGS